MRPRIVTLIALLASAPLACGNADPVTCGSMPCWAGDVCRARYGGADAGVAAMPTYSCASVPVGCVLTDQMCSNSCGCADSICGPAGASSVSGNGRLVICRGP